MIIQYTEADLEAAIQFAMNMSDSNLRFFIDNVGLVNAHRQAIVEAFMDELDGTYIDILRQALQDVNKEKYRFTDART